MSLLLHIIVLLQHSMAGLLEEMDGVLQGQKKVSGVADKAQWWEGRKALDTRVEVNKYRAELFISNSTSAFAY